MKSKKAFVKSDGSIGVKEHSCIEYVDKKYQENVEKQKAYINDLIAKPSKDNVKESDIDTPKKIAEMSGFKVGDSVKVKSGIVDPDDSKIDISNWCGRIKEIYDDGIAMIVWDSLTILGMEIKKIRKYEKEGFEWNEMYLGLYEIDKCEPRDGIDDADEEISKIHWQYFRKEYFPEYYD